MQHNSPSASARQLRSLVVEADSETQQMLELALSIRGHIVATCESSTAAKDLLRRTPYQIVVIGANLPDASGAHLASDLRSDIGGRPVLVLLATGSTGEDGEDARAAVDEVLPWPANMDQLRHRFDRIEELASLRARAMMTAAEHQQEPLLVLNPNGAIRAAGAGAESLFGFPPTAMPGANGFSFFHPDDAAVLLSIITEALVTPGQTRAVEVRARREGDSWRPVAVTAINQLSEPLIGGIAITLKGPAARIDQADQVMRAAIHDAATGLPNAALFYDRIDHAISRGTRHDQPVIVMSIDFNGFQDEHGIDQEVDDGLLIALSQRIRSCLRMSDTTARLGYDQFGIILEEVVDINNVRVVADRLIRTLDIPFYDDGREKLLIPNIGIAISSVERFRAEDLLRDANIARSWARVQGPGRYVVFDDNMSAVDNEQVTSQFPIDEVMAAIGAAPPPSTIDDRLAMLQERVHALEQDIERMSRKGLAH